LSVNFSGFCLIKSYGHETNGDVKTLLSSIHVFQNKWHACKCRAQDAISFNFNDNAIFPKIPRLMQSRQK
jgi:hypothetical protein